MGSAGVDGVRLTARPDGRVSSPLHGIDAAAQVLTVEATRDLTALYEPPATSRRVSMDQLVDVLETEHRVQAAHDTVARVSILGPVAVEAPGQVDDDRRELLTEIACFLALHPVGVHANRISAAIWPRGVDETLRASALGQLSAWFGATADGHPVVEQDAGIWRLAPGAVDVDWATFRAALNRASEDGANRETHLRAALDLVTGPAFADVPAGRFGWLESLTVEGDIAIAVNLTVQAVAEAAAARDDEVAARSALTQGLTMLPASEELWRSRLRLAAHFGERSDVEAVADEMYAAVAEHGAFGGTTGETDALVDELAPGHRARVA
ncbi:BTAD domain-containing putative transcriptional regulator [Aeromicrobium sp. UC242_57]|uniref:AfsR/SARP family transcriptional regulator n=1 Tax=Aeromicrobium sp. UC242_57 TaxID=3374624 RepID=UPI0037B6A9F6